MSERRNKNGPPCSAAVNALLKHYESERRQANFNANRDRGKDTVQQFGTLQELNRTVDMLFTIQTTVAMRTRMDLLVEQYRTNIHLRTSAIRRRRPASVQSLRTLLR